MSASETKWVRLGEYIEQSDKRNSDGALTETDVQGISTDKCFIPTKANLDGVSVLSYKIVALSEFAYVADTSRRGDKVALALNSSEKNILISSIYTVFHSTDENILLPEYMFLLFNRSEFDRYSRFNSWGSCSCCLIAPNLTVILDSILGVVRGKLLIGQRWNVYKFHCRRLRCSVNWLPLTTA